MSRVEAEIGDLLFRTTGSIRFDPEQREATQRSLLKALAPKVDVDEFMRGNPILRRDRFQVSAAGCLIAAGLVVGLLALIVYRLDVR
jgi:hypothetical protein